METISPKKAIIFIGLQASGKSTFYHQRWEKDHVHINLDILHTRNKERLLLEDCLQKGRSFVVDNTNPAVADREKYILMAKEYGYETDKLMYFNADFVMEGKKLSDWLLMLPDIKSLNAILGKLGV